MIQGCVSNLRSDKGIKVSGSVRGRTLVLTLVTPGQVVRKGARGTVKLADMQEAIVEAGEQLRLAGFADVQEYMPTIDRVTGPDSAVVCGCALVSCTL